LGGGEKRALAAIVDEVRPLGHGLVVQPLDEGALVVGAGLAHEVGGGAAEVLLPPRRAVGAAGRFDARGRGRAGAFQLGKQARLIRRQVLKRHAFSFGLQDNPPKGRARFQAKLRRGPKRGLCRIEFSGSIAVATPLIFPGLAGTPARLHWRVSCFWVLTSPNSARINAPSGESRLVRDSRQRGA